jgi:hypothetical protein
MSTLNWPQLVAKGRAKDIGIPWNEEELYALYELKIPVAYVRSGVLTLEDYAEAEAGGVAPVTRAALEARAKELGIDFAPEAPDAVLEKAISAAEKEAAKAAKAAKAAAEKEAANKPK